jgi:hypothetical protein
MNRTEALAVLKTINIPCKTVHGEAIGTGFFFADAVGALGDFERASRYLAALIKVGAVRCTTVRLGFSTHDFYAVVSA